MTYVIKFTRVLLNELNELEFSGVRQNETKRQFEERLKAAKEIYDKGHVNELLMSPFLFTVNEYSVDCQGQPPVVEIEQTYKISGPTGYRTHDRFNFTHPIRVPLTETAIQRNEGNSPFRNRKSWHTFKHSRIEKLHPTDINSQ